MKTANIVRGIMIVTGLALAASGAYARQTGVGAPANNVIVERGRVVMTRRHTTMMLEPYAPNIIRVSISRLKAYALASPGYGIIAKPDASGWQYERTAEGGTYRSPQLAVTILGSPKHHSPHLLGQAPIGKFFSNNGAPKYANVRLRFQLPDGHTVVNLENWFMNSPSYGAGDMDILHDRRPSDPPFYRMGATFGVQPGEHYYGLGENQEGRLDHRD